MKSANSVSGLRGDLNPYPVVCSQKVVEGTASKRAQAHRQLLRKLRTDLEVIHQKEQVAS